jgi:predicted aspartyl protease
MACVSFPAYDAAEVIEAEFVTAQGGTRSLKLLVDTGFSGRSSVIIGADASELVRATLPDTQTTGALQGQQNRAWVTCRISGLNFQATIIAIIADVSVLSLPLGVDGMAGLSFLRHFARWGAEETASGWRFFLFDHTDYP